MLNFNVMDWTRDYRYPLRQVLPREFLDLFSSKRGPDGEDPVIWVGNGVKEDIENALGIDIKNRFVDSQLIFDGMIQRGALCHWDDSRPRSALIYIQLSLWGWKRVTKTFLYNKKARSSGFDPRTGAAKYDDNKGTCKRSWQKMVSEDPLMFPPSWRRVGRPDECPRNRHMDVMYDYSRNGGDLTVRKCLFVLPPQAGGDKGTGKEELKSHLT